MTAILLAGGIGFDIKQLKIDKAADDANKLSLTKFGWSVDELRIATRGPNGELNDAVERLAKGRDKVPA